VSIIDDLEAFLQEHRRCGGLRSGTCERPAAYEVVRMDCSCGGYMAKPVKLSDEDRDRRGQIG
jgi:hypothetical protein